MASRESLDLVYMQTALLHASLSKAARAKVGSCLVTKQGVCLTGYNGEYSGGSNICEDEDGLTKPTVIHSELNCVLRAAKEGISVLDSTLYVTLSPCQSCASMLIQAGIKRVVYLQQYRCSEGLDLLRKAGIIVDKLEL